MLESNVKFGEVHTLASLVSASDAHVSFQNIFGSANGGVNLVAFKAGQRLDTHVAPADIMVYVVEGEISFTINDTPHTIGAGQFLLLGTGVAHSVEAKADSKMMLVKVKA